MLCACVSFAASGFWPLNSGSTSEQQLLFEQAVMGVQIVSLLGVYKQVSVPCNVNFRVAV